MLKFMKNTQKITPERLQKQKELFDFNKACYHGFPAKPSALAWDPQLRLLALATKTAEIRIYGIPGVEVYGRHDNSEAPVTHLTFLSGQCRLVSLCEDNSLHLWQLTPKEESSGMQLVQANSTSLEGKLKRISVVVADGSGEHLMVGTEGGNIYLLNLSTFAMSDNIIYQDVVMQNVPEDYKVNPGPVEAIAEHPTEPDKVLIGYQRGLIVLWDKKNLCADQTYVCSQQLESVCWHADGSQFTTSHNDGSYMVWSSTDSTNPSDGPHTVYGPFPCKPISKILRPCSKSGDLVVFSGGMPRASYGDRNTVTVICGEYHVTFNITSKIIDFAVVEDEEAGHASCLVVLAEEEVVFIDLDSEDWPAFTSPYLTCLHSSAVTCSFLASSVSADIYDKIKEAGEKQQGGLSKRLWPINGGKLKNTDAPKQRDILLTGHEDGTVQFWDASGVSLKLLYKLSTAQLFVSEDLGGDGAAAEDDDWPPFRKTGLFDPYSDDPRLGVKKMEMCPYTGMLVVAGTAGQILILNLEMEEKEIVPECVNVNLVAETDNFVWKSHNKLDMQTEAVKFGSGMQPTVVIQFYPPASCTSLTLHSEWGLVACGTAHGFALFDIIQKKNILSKSTLSPLDLANAADEGPMSRRKSLKKSLRESFRRLRRGRSQRKTGKTVATSPTSPGEDESEEGEEKEFGLSDEGEGEQEEETGREDNREEESSAVAQPLEEIPVEQSAEPPPLGAAEPDAIEAPPVVETAPLVEAEIQDADEEPQVEEEDIEINEQDLDGEHVLDNPGHGRKSEETTEGRTGVMEQVPFFYYVTPKRFRETTKQTPEKERKESKGKLKKEEETESVEDGKGKSKFKLAQVFSRKEKIGSIDEHTEDEQHDNEDMEQQQKNLGLFQKIFSRQIAEQEGVMDTNEHPSSSVSTPKGVNRLKEWLQKRESEDEMAKVEGVEPADSREGSLRRLFRRSRPSTLDSPLEDEARKSIGTKSPVEPPLSKRQRLMLAFRQRHHSEEALPPSETGQTYTIEEVQVKSRSLTRPSKLWLTGRTQSETRPSPIASEISPVHTGAPDPSEPRKRTFFNLPLKSFKSRQESDTEVLKPMPSDIYNVDDKDEGIHRTPSYERAISDDIIKSKISKKSRDPEGGTGKFKQLIKQRSEVILRPFNRRNKNPENRKSAPIPDVSLTGEDVEVPDIEARHPSISTYIDDTPTAAVPPEIPPGTPSPKPSHPSQPQQVREALSPEQLLTPDSEADSVVLDLRSLQSTPDVVRKIPDSRGSTLERTFSRRLTFSLPFGSAGGGGATSTEEEGVKPVERAIEARSQTSDYIGSMVRCLHLTKCFIANTQMMSATLWAGTNSGAIFVFTIAIPPSEKRNDITLSVQLGKEIHLKHGAPVISICILDGASRPFPQPMAVKKDAAPAPNTNQPHRVLICSEEQFKVFTLPQLKPFCKFKLTAHEGSRVRKIGYANFVSSADAAYSEAAFMVITNLGDFNVFSLPDCRRQIQAPYLKKEDISGINSVVFSSRGEALYMMSPCELERLSLSARHATRASGTVPVLVKPKPTPEVKEEPPKVKEEPPKVKPSEPTQDEDKEAPTSPDTSAEPPPAVPPTVEREAENETNKDKEDKEDNKEKEDKESLEAVGGSLKKLEDVKENGDSSVLSGDITIDSIRDHMDDLKVSEKTDKNTELEMDDNNPRTVLTSSTSTVKQESSSSVTVVKSTTITSVSSSSQESSSVQVVETASTEVNHSTLNGTE